MALQVAVVVALGLRAEEAADAHTDCAGDELGDAAKDDELGLAEGGEASGEGEGDGEAVRQADDAVGSMSE